MDQKVYEVCIEFYVILKYIFETSITSHGLRWEFETAGANH